MWETVQYVGSGFGLLAFVVAGALSAYRYRLKHQVDLIKSAPAKDRIDAISAMADFLKIDLGDLPAEHKKEIVLAQLRNTASKQKYIAVVFVVVAGFFFAAALGAMVLARSWTNVPSAAVPPASPPVAQNTVQPVASSNTDHPALPGSLPEQPRKPTNTSASSNVNDGGDTKKAAVTPSTGSSSAENSTPIPMKKPAQANVGQTNKATADVWNDAPTTAWAVDACNDGSVWFKSDDGWSNSKSNGVSAGSKMSLLWHGESSPKNLKIVVTHKSPWEDVVVEAADDQSWDLQRWPNGAAYSCRDRLPHGNLGRRINFTLPLDIPPGDYWYFYTTNADDVKSWAGQSFKVR